MDSLDGLYGPRERAGAPVAHAGRDRCAICAAPPDADAVLLTDDARDGHGATDEAEAGLSRWLVCKTCCAAIHAELRRARLRSRHRLRIAMGVVAAERRPRAGSRRRARLGWREAAGRLRALRESAPEKLLILFFLAAVSVQMLAVALFISFVAVHR